MPDPGNDPNYLISREHVALVRAGGPTGTDERKAFEAIANDCSAQVRRLRLQLSPTLRFVR